ncbi:MAG: adenine phosphoribosyltransferase [Bacteroidota bacterium]
MTTDLRSKIRSIPDFPKKGILFRDITTLLKDPAAMAEAIDQFSNRFAGAGIQKVVCIESRGFIMGGALAQRFNAGFVPVRKPGKLPAETLREEYALEYGTDTLEVHRDAIQQGDRVLIHDDLLATGGTAAAACKLVESLGGQILGIAFLVELSFLKGRDRLGEYDIFSIIDFASE